MTTIVETPAILDTKNGMLMGLKEKGWEEGKNFTLDYQNANGAMPTQQQISQKFVGRDMDLVLTITTPSTQSMASASQDIPIVFATVTDPVGAKIIPQFEKPGGNVTGVSDASPLAEQLALFQEIVSDLKTIGFLYNPSLANSAALLRWIKEEARKSNITIVEAPAPTTNEVIAATRSLLGKVDAIYIPTDTTILSAVESIVKVGRETQTPVFSGEPGSVKRGAVATVGLDYIEIGRLSGLMAGDILNGATVGKIDAILAKDVQAEKTITINLSAAEATGLKISDALKKRAKIITE
ncbi:MAG: ABC transporter substrate-binding protein [Proteobacteria bacterium]|nr:ABC transporter substrate-binding protein [Pseudomonadota bacterium]